MKTFNVPQCYNGFCAYLNILVQRFDKVIKLFILSYLHPIQYLQDGDWHFVVINGF
jgi:hypothetical protein